MFDLNPATFIEIGLPGADMSWVISRWGLPDGSTVMPLAAVRAYIDRMAELVTLFTTAKLLTQADDALEKKLPAPSGDANAAGQKLATIFDTAGLQIIHKFEGGMCRRSLAEPPRLDAKLVTLAAVYDGNGPFQVVALCDHCNGSFVQGRSDARFCSASCRSQSARDKR